MLSDEVKILEDKCVGLESMLALRNGDLEKALKQMEKVQDKFEQLKTLVSGAKWTIVEAGPGIKKDYVLRMIEGFLKVIDEGYYVGKKEAKREVRPYGISDIG